MSRRRRADVTSDRDRRRGPRRATGADATLVTGRRAVTEAIRSGAAREILVIASPKPTQGMRAVLDAAERADVPVRIVPRAKLDAMAADHQGVVARIGSGAHGGVSGVRALGTGPGRLPVHRRRRRRDPRRHHGSAEPRRRGALRRVGGCRDAGDADEASGRRHRRRDPCLGGRAAAPAPRSRGQHRAGDRTPPGRGVLGRGPRRRGSRVRSTTTPARPGASPSSWAARARGWRASRGSAATRSWRCPCGAGSDR